MSNSRQLKHVRMKLEHRISPKTQHTLEGDWPPSAQEVREIMAAIKRIDDGSFGYCIDCNMQMPKERLEARPHAARCCNCQQQLETRRLAG
jgi:hypothetical protein